MFDTATVERPGGARPAPPARPRPLRLGRPGDAAERAADAAASRVVGGPRHPGAPRASRSADSVPGEVDTALAGPGRALDATARRIMEAGFGADLTSVRVHADALAADAATALGAPAFAAGEAIGFGAGEYRPDTPRGQRMLAHEIAHVLQARGGGAGERATVRPYTEFDAAAQTGGKSLGWAHPASAKLRVGDDGLLAAEDKGWGANQSKRAWTTPALMASANATLKQIGSHAQLKAKTGTIAGKPPDNAKAAAITLTEVEPVKAFGSGAFELESDCGAACRQVIGNPSGKDVAVLSNRKDEQYTKARTYHGGDPTAPEEFSEEIYKKEFGAGLTRAEAYAKYDALDAGKKDAFDRKYGINRYARAKVGQGLTVSTEKDMPGFDIHPGYEDQTWNFHYAAVVLSSGTDYVTLENAAGWAPTDWIFFLYGQARLGQTFHEYHGDTKTHGTDWTTMVVQPESALSVVTKLDDAPMLIGGAITKLPKGTALTVSRKAFSNGVTWLSVKVVGGPHDGKSGKISAAFAS